MDNDKTRLYSVENFDNMLVYDTLKDVYESLDERGYNPTNQIVGYLISGDPGYISNHKDARKKITRLDRNVIVEKLLKYYLENNKSIKSNDKGNNLLYDTLFIGLTCNREVLYKRIDDRVDLMIKNGLLEEVKSFYDRDIRTKPLLSGIGYKELYKYFDNEIDYDEAIRLIKRNSRRYAKRQYTFFNNQFKINWFMTNFDNFDETIREVCNYIDEKETIS